MPNMVVSSMPAKDLWKKILNSYFETGLPFLCFKDSANRANPNAHSGIIRSSNLCTEIFQNTEPSHYRVEVEFDDGERIYFEENEEVVVDSGVTKRANKLTSIDSLKGKKIFNTQRVQTGGQTAVCNLASINLSKIHTHEDIERIVPIAVRMLDNVIDLNFYPSRKVKVTNMANRAIGLGVMGEAELLASKLVLWGSEAHFSLIDSIMEAISYNAIKASAMLAKERGAYPTYEGSNWSKGIFPIDKANEKAKAIVERSFHYDWESLRDLVKSEGIRNGYLMAIAPTSSISILVGTTQTIEPIYKQIWHEENLSGMIKSVVPNLTLETINFYPSAYSINQHDLVRAAAVRQKWIDQGQSLNIFIRLDSVSGKQLHEIYMLAWSLGLKSTYYLRSQSKEADDVVDRSMECVNCQ